MKHQKLTLIAILLFGIVSTESHAQEGTSASGGDAYGSNGSVNYSVGQPVYSTHEGSNGSVAEGVQQPLEISLVTSVEDHQLEMEITAFPNPTRDQLTLHADGENTTGMRYQLVDMQGRVVKDLKVEGAETQVSLSDLESATYFLKVIKEEKAVKTFKILKH